MLFAILFLVVLLSGADHNLYGPLLLAAFVEWVVEMFFVSCYIEEH